MSDKEEVLKTYSVDPYKLSMLIDALKECLKTEDADSYQAAIHELVLPTGEKCQLILQIEKQDYQGHYPSGLAIREMCQCISIEH